MSTFTIPKHIDDRMTYLRFQGYIWDEKWSIAAGGVILRKGNDFYLFDLEFNEYHNPPALLSIKF